MSNDYIQYAKDRAKAEKELKIEPWVAISVERQLADGTREKLYSYDIPRHMLERWRWVINWRLAKLQCQYPRSSMGAYYQYYDKRTGLETDFGSLLYKLSAAKAQITKVERAIAQHTEGQTCNNLFFNPETDEMLLKAKNKLNNKKSNYNALYATLEEEVRQRCQETTIY
jgi:hypothetical protein